jgi:hypothetical protein
LAYPVIRLLSRSLAGPAAGRQVDIRHMGKN